MHATGGRGTRVPRALAAVLVASFLLKLALLIPAHSIQPVDDSLDYVNMALGLFHDGTSAYTRAPGYPAMLAGVYWVSGGLGLPLPQRSRVPELAYTAGLTAFDVARMVQVALSTLSVLLVYLVARRFFSRRVSVAAATIVAFYPELVVYSHLLWSETLFVFLMLSAFVLALTAVRSRRLAPALACGAILGLSALTRQVGLVVACVVAAWVWIDVATDNRGISLQRPLRAGWKHSRSATVLAAAILFATGATILPWTLGNSLQRGQFVLISATGGSGLLFGATDDPIREIESFGKPGLRFLPLERDRLCGQRAREIIAADPAGWVWRCLTHNLPSLFQPATHGLMVHILTPGRSYGLMPARLVQLLIVLAIACYLALAVAAIVGVWSAGERRYTLLFVLMLAAFVASHTIILGVSRHRLPLEVMAAVFAGFAVGCHRGELRSRMTRPRLLGIVTSVLLFAGIVAASPIDRIGLYWLRAERIAIVK